MTTLEEEVRKKLTAIYDRVTYTPPRLKLTFNKLNHVANNRIRLMWNFLYYFEIGSISDNNEFLGRIRSLNNVLLEVVALTASDDFDPLHPSSDLLMLLGRSLNLKAFDQDRVITEIGLFYNILDSIMIHNQYYVFTPEESDIRFFTYRWADFCYTYRAHTKEPDINDLSTTFQKMLSVPYSQKIYNEVYKKTNTIGNTSPMHAYGAFMRNFYKESHSKYTIFTESDNDQYRTIESKDNSKISDVIPFFTISLLSRISVDYETLISALNKIYDNKFIKDAPRSNNKLLAYTYPMTQVLIGLPILASDQWKEGSQYNLNRTQVDDINSYTNVLSKSTINLIGRDEKGKAFYGNVPNPLCVGSSEARNWVVDNNSFVYNPSAFSQSFAKNAALGKNGEIGLIYKAINGDERQPPSDYNPNRILAGGRELYGNKLLVTNAELRNLTIKSGDNKFSQYLDNTFNFQSVKNNSQIRIFVGSSGAGKSTTIASALYTMTYQQNIYPQVIDKIGQTSEVLPRGRGPVVSASNSYFAIDTFKALPSSNSCTTVTEASTENKTSSRNFNLWNMLHINNTASSMSYPHLLACKSFMMLDTMGFENIAVKKNGKMVLLNPLDLILYPLLTKTELELDQFSIPDRIDKGVITEWEIKDYHKRVTELVDSFTSLLRVTRELKGGKLNLLPILMMNTGSEEYKELMKNDIISFLVDYNRPRYEVYKKRLARGDSSPKLEAAMIYDVNIILLFNKNIERKRRDVQVFNLLKIFSSSPSINYHVANIITLDHIRNSSIR